MARPASADSIRAVNRCIVTAGGLLIFLGAWLIAADVVIRAIFAHSWLYSFELSSYAFAIAVAFSLGDGILHRTHIRVDVLYRQFPLIWRSLADVLAYTLIAFLAVGLARYAYDVAAGSWELGSRANSSLATPLYIPQTFWALGLALFAVTCVVTALRLWLHMSRGHWHRIEQIAGAPDSSVAPE